MTTAVDPTPAVSIPEHVDPSRVVDFDMYADPAYIANPYQRLQELVTTAPPIFWTPRNGGHWVFLSFAANFDAARDTETFSSTMMPRELIDAFMASLPPGTPRIPHALPVSVDPPDHARYRAPLQKVFSPKVINALRDEVRDFTNYLIDQVIEQGECEFMSSIAETLPVQIFLKLMGLPSEKQAEYRELVKEQLADRLQDMERTIARMQEIVASMRDTILERRDNPKDDLISYLWQADIDGEQPTQEEVEDFCFLLFIAGLDTVMNGMGHGVRHLASDPQLQQQLREQPQLIDEAVEELMRRYSFVVPVRRVTADTEFMGVKLKQEEKIQLFLPAADLDNQRFPEAAQFDLQRENKAHIAFNAGPHRCVGSHLARLELRVLYEQLLSRLPEIKLDPDKPPVYRCGPIIGVETLHLRW